MTKVLSAVGILFVLLAILYFAVPADSLPAWVPGADPNLTRHHFTHGVASLVVGGGLLAYARTRRQ